MGPRRRSLGIRLLAVFATAGLIAYAAYAVAGIRDVTDPHCDRPADLGVLDPGETSGVSHDVARDIVRCDRLDDFTKPSVKAAIGSPVHKHEGGAQVGETEGSTWYVSVGHTLGSDHELVIEFDAAGRVIDTSTIESASGSYD